MKPASDHVFTVFLPVLVLAGIIVGLLYNRYRGRHNNDQLLQQQQREIREKVEALQILLEEKEWLLKEVHHRVKNNLQTVMSLLESQSAYLEQDALRAIRDSQRRVYAMSLLHQKLHQYNSLSSIDMACYLPELIKYLQDSFEDKDHIRFQVEIGQVILDVSQAVPVGLILNEAVTNAIKHAFHINRSHKEISVRLLQQEDKKIVLTVFDNGSGLPADPGNKKSSLDMRLMRGLAEDLNGIFVQRSEGGTSISVIFPPADLRASLTIPSL